MHDDPFTTPEEQPIVPAPAGSPLPSPHAARAAMDQKERHQHMSVVLTNAIEEGKHQVPEVPDPLVSRPNQIESWRVFKIMSEFVEGFDLIRKYSPAATFFGSAREVFDASVYQAAQELAARLAKAGIAVITGGSEGIMQAANKGAYEAGGASIGLNVRLADNQQTNKYVTDQMMFDHFFVRKVMLTFASEVYIYFPGGFGTLDEFTEILTLVQTKKIRPIPIVLYGKEFWTPLIDLFTNELFKKYHSISEEDLSLFHVVDSVDEAFEYITKAVKGR